MLKGTMKLNSLVLSLSMITSGCALADWSKNMTFSVPTQIDMAKLSPQEREEIEREQARLMAEKQALLEMSLTHEIGEQNLQFKSLLAKIYADNKYNLFWHDKAAEKQFLREYAAMVASGISKGSAQSLENLSQAEQIGGLTYDVLLTDAFLDYLYYSSNLNQQAQRWLYGAGVYKPQAPSEEQLQQWFNAVLNEELVVYLERLSTHNSLYRQTLDALPSMISTSGLTPIGKMGFL